MEYTKTVWKDLPDTSTPITADKLQNIEDGVEYLFEHGVGGGDSLPIGVELDYDGTSIPTGWEMINNPNLYSTSEVKTNKIWIDGQPIYRKVFTGTMPSATVSTEVIDIGNISFKEIWIDISASFIVQSQSESLPLNFYYTDNDYSRFWINKSVKKVKVRTGIDMSSYLYVVVLEYTKSTD